MNRGLRLAALGLALATGVAQGAEIALYPTGPAEDAAFLRFVNATGQPGDIRAEGAQAGITLPATLSATAFQTVPANQPVRGVLQTPAGPAALDLRVAPGEFASVVMAASPGAAPELIVLRETPDDFNAMRASLALVVADAGCAAAGLTVSGRDVAIFQDVAPGSVARRAINPVRLSVQARCAGQPAGQVLDLGELAPGGRYSVVIAPSPAGTVTLFVNDQSAD